MQSYEMTRKTKTLFQVASTKQPVNTGGLQLTSFAVLLPCERHHLNSCHKICFSVSSTSKELSGLLNSVSSSYILSGILLSHQWADCSCGCFLSSCLCCLWACVLPAHGSLAGGWIVSDVPQDISLFRNSEVKSLIPSENFRTLPEEVQVPISSPELLPDHPTPPHPNPLWSTLL